jgi:hypothetical protein
MMMALSLALPGGALAGGDHHKGYRSNQHNGHAGKYHGYRGHAGKHHGYRGHSGKQRGYRYHGGYSRKYVTKYNYDDDNDGENLLIGLLVGGVVGYAIGDSRHDASPSVYYPPASPAPREIHNTAQYAYEGGENACLQEREYQNKVVIGGKTVDAYGTACLQPDGSWRYGPAQLASF